VTGEELVVGRQEAIGVDRRLTGVLRLGERRERHAPPLAGAGARATLVRMRKIQVLREERPSNRSIPRITAIHVSCTASSAAARLGT